jgi:hypothetical protein
MLGMVLLKMRAGADTCLQARRYLYVCLTPNGIREIANPRLRISH